MYVNTHMEEKLNKAYDLLRAVLCDSTIENEYDQEIYEFLKENDQLPQGYEPPYWEV